MDFALQMLIIVFMHLVKELKGNFFFEMRKIALSINLFTIFYNFHDKYFSPLSSLTNILRGSG